MIGAIVLAAGQSRRMGTQKLLLPLGGKTVIACVVDVLLASGLGPVLVVVGQGPELISSALKGRSVKLVTNPEPSADMLGSVRCGLRALPVECDGVLVALGDQPSIQPRTISALSGIFESSGQGIVVPVYGGKRGHPILISTRFREEIMTGFATDGLCGLLRAHPDKVLEWAEAGAEVLRDVDTLADYQRELSLMDQNRGVL